MSVVKNPLHLCEELSIKEKEDGKLLLIEVGSDIDRSLITRVEQNNIVVLYRSEAISEWIDRINERYDIETCTTQRNTIRSIFNYKTIENLPTETEIETLLKDI